MLQAVYDFDEDDLELLDAQSIAVGAVYTTYAYEGIIVPRGQIFLGRWWRVDSQDVHASLSNLEYGMGGVAQQGPDTVQVDESTEEDGENGNSDDGEEESSESDSDEPQEGCRIDKSNLFSGPFVYWRQLPASADSQASFDDGE